MVTFDILFGKCWVGHDCWEERLLSKPGGVMLISTEPVPGLDLQPPHLALSPLMPTPPPQSTSLRLWKELVLSRKTKQKQNETKHVISGFHVMTDNSSKMPVLVRNRWLHFPAQMKEGVGTPLLSETEAPSSLALAGSVFAYLSGHLVINLKKLKRKHPWCPAEASLPPPPLLSPFIWALSSLPCLHFSLLCRPGSLS